VAFLALPLRYVSLSCTQSRSSREGIRGQRATGGFGITRGALTSLPYKVRNPAVQQSEARPKNVMAAISLLSFGCELA
jgi:hypothetical protein